MCVSSSVCSASQADTSEQSALYADSFNVFLVWQRELVPYAASLLSLAWSAAVGGEFDGAEELGWWYESARGTAILRDADVSIPARLRLACLTFGTAALERGR